MTTHDAMAVFARNLLAEFGKNTAVEIDHRYGTNTAYVVVTRTKNVIATIEFRHNGLLAHNYDGRYWGGTEFWLKKLDGEWEDHTRGGSPSIALEVSRMKRFPKPRNMKRSWSPIRLTESAKQELDIRRATMNGYFV